MREFRLIEDYENESKAYRRVAISTVIGVYLRIHTIEVAACLIGSTL